jgi:Fe-S cluster biogenesis protein NfuA
MIRIGGGNNMREKVEKALNDIRPHLQADGGNVELVDVEDGIVKVRLTGACAGCPMSQMTLKQGIEGYVKRAIPEIISVESV